MLTIFSTPKPFYGNIETIQMNAFRSWSVLQPKCEIIILGNEYGAAEKSAELNLKHIPDIVRNEYGTPLINSLFEAAEKVSTNDLLCYVNSDIILTSDFLEVVKRVRSHFHTFLLSGRRVNLDIVNSLDFSRHDWESDLIKYAHRKGKLASPLGGCDYFVYTKGIFGRIPPFAIGRVRWDSWLLYKARSNNIPLLDATNVIIAIHQNHDDSHHAQGEKGVWRGYEALKNFELLGGYEYTFNILNATHRLTKNDIKITLIFNPIYLVRRFATLPALYPSLKPLAKLVKYFAILWSLLKRMYRIHL